MDGFLENSPSKPVLLAVATLNGQDVLVHISVQRIISTDALVEEPDP